jgi:hypothetical protein
MSFWDTANPAKPTGIKDPNAILDYPIDYTAWLADITDTYSSHSVIVAAGSIAVQSSGYSSGKIIVWLSGGTVGETAAFTIRIVTFGGRTDDRTFYLKIKER